MAPSMQERHTTASFRIRLKPVQSVEQLALLALFMAVMAFFGEHPEVAMSAEVLGILAAAKSAAEPGNDDAPIEVVIDRAVEIIAACPAGHAGAVQAAIEQCRQTGATTVMRALLPFGGAAHRQRRS